MNLLLFLHTEASMVQGEVENDEGPPWIDFDSDAAWPFKSMTQQQPKNWILPGLKSSSKSATGRGIRLRISNSRGYSNLSDWDKNRIARLIYLARKLGNITHACKEVGVSRTYFYKWISWDKWTSTFSAHFGDGLLLNSWLIRLMAMKRKWFAPGGFLRSQREIRNFKYLPWYLALKSGIQQIWIVTNCFKSCLS